MWGVQVRGTLLTLGETPARPFFLVHRSAAQLPHAQCLFAPPLGHCPVVVRRSVSAHRVPGNWRGLRRPRKEEGADVSVPGWWGQGNF